MPLSTKRLRSFLKDYDSLPAEAKAKADAEAKAKAAAAPKPAAPAPNPLVMLQPICSAVYLRMLQGLRVGVDAHEFHTINTTGDHVCHGVPATAT